MKRIIADFGSVLDSGNCSGNRPVAIGVKIRPQQAVLGVSKSAPIETFWHGHVLILTPMRSVGRSPWTARDAFVPLPEVKTGFPRGRGRPPHEMPLDRTPLSQAHTQLADFRFSDRVGPPCYELLLWLLAAAVASSSQRLLSMCEAWPFVQVHFVVWRPS